MTVGERLARIETLLETNSPKIQRLLQLMEGREGIVVRLDRVEQSQKFYKKWASFLTAAVLGVLASKWTPKLLAFFS